MNKWVWVTITVFLTGCATTGTVEDGRLSWQGAAFESVVGLWGTPNSSTTFPDGRQGHTWISEGPVSRGSFFPSIGIFGGSGGFGFGTGVTLGGGGGQIARCERNLIFMDGRVVEQAWQGPAQYCGNFRRH